MFKVGQKVVCIDDNWQGPKVKRPVLGEIYTVSWCGRNRVHGGLCCLLMEIDNGDPCYDFYCWHFRPVDTTFGEQVCESLEVMTEPELV